MDVQIGNSNSVNVNIGNNGEIDLTNDVKMYRGPRGYSSYELALQNGFKGTEQEYLESLKGEPGSTDYLKMINQPSIEGVKLVNDKSFEDLGAYGLTNTEIEKLINTNVL